MVLGKDTIFKRRPRGISPLAQPQEAGGKELPQLTQDASEVIYAISSVFPFDFFPDKVIVRLNHIDIMRGIFFWSGATERLQIIDIREVTVYYNPLFATLTIIPIAPPQDISITVKFLRRSQALLAKRLIVGLLECHQQQIDLSKYSKEELFAYLQEIGRAKR